MMPRDRYRSLLDAPVGRGHFAVKRLHNDLHAERWVFYYFGEEHALTLDTYYYLTRPTKRHGWKVEKGYNRLAGGRDFHNMENPPLPEDVKREALEVFTGEVRVCMWREVRTAKPLSQTEGYMRQAVCLPMEEV